MSAPSAWSDARKALCAATVLLATAASSLMQTFLTVSLPTATAEIGAASWYGWVTGLYLAASTVFIPPWAILSDRIGPRLVHVSGMAIWAAGTITVSLAGSAPLLLGARAIQGIGAAAVVPAGFAAITAVYQKNYGRLIGLMGAVQATVTLAGGPLGGWLGTWFGWRHSLQLVAYLALVPIVLGLFSLPGGTAGDGAVAGGAARFRRLLRSPVVRGAVIQTMLLAAIAFGVSTYLPLLLQSHFQLDLSRTALFATPTLLGVAIGSVVGGLLADSRDTTAIAWLVVLTRLILAWTPFVAAAAIGSALAASGVGIGLPSQLIAVERVGSGGRISGKGNRSDSDDDGSSSDDGSKGASGGNASKAGGIIQGSRNIGGAIGVAVLGLPLQFGVTPEQGAQYAFWIMLAVAVVAGLGCQLNVDRILRHRIH